MVGVEEILVAVITFLMHLKYLHLALIADIGQTRALGWINILAGRSRGEMDKDFIREVEMKGLLIGIHLTREKVIAEICPECTFKTPFCQWMLEEVLLDKPDLAFVCKGMRAWVRRSN